MKVRERDDEPWREGAVDMGTDRAALETEVRPAGAGSARRCGRWRSTSRRRRAFPRVTPPPASTTPQTSCPIVTGGTLGYSPASMWRSVPQIPAAAHLEQRLTGARLALRRRSASPTLPGPGASFVRPRTATRPPPASACRRSSRAGSRRGRRPHSPAGGSRPSEQAVEEPVAERSSEGVAGPEPVDDLDRDRVELDDLVAVDRKDALRAELDDRELRPELEQAPRRLLGRSARRRARPPPRGCRPRSRRARARGGRARAPPPPRPRATAGGRGRGP